MNLNSSDVQVSMKRWLLGIFFFAILVFAQELAFVDNSFGLDKGAPGQVQISVVEQDKAINLFRAFVRNKEIPFKYPIDGCYARAHEMARIAEKEQIVMGKVFAEGRLQVKTSYQKYPIVQWGWHVAPIAFVKGAAGANVLMVFDPSLFNKPVTVDEWKQKMMDTTNGAQPQVTLSYYGARYQYFPKDYEGYKKHWLQEDLNGVKATFARFSPFQDFSSSPAESAGNNQDHGGVQ